ncbi:MAG: tetratricopeptide repeat protein, partial [Pseudomonadota bacterium]
IRIEEQLPAFAALGDQRAVAATWGQIADIYVHAGDLDEALRIRREKQVPAFDRDTDKRPIAVALGKIADVVESQGDLDEALRIHRDERLPVYDALNDKHGLMHVYWRIARILRVKSVVREVAAEARLEPLISAYQLARELKRVDALGVTALELGDLLLSLHAKKEAEVVLRTAVASCEEQGVHDKQRQLKAKLTQLRTIPG